MTLAVIDNNIAFCNSLKQQLDEIHVVTEVFVFSNGADYINYIEQATPDLTFIAINNNDDDALICDLLKNYGNSGFIVMVEHGGVEQMQQLIDFGAKNYVLKDELSSEIIEGILQMTLSHIN
jgi:DNA-binding NarL/FixJ family response regulator